MLLFSLLVVLGITCGKKPEEKLMYTLFVGTYTYGDSEGIYSLQFNAETGNLDSIKLAAKLPNPSFLTISKDKQNLYAVQETSDFDSLGGGVTAFKLNEGILELQNSMATQGAGPCHVSLSGDGHLAVSNHGGGNVALFSLKNDGSIMGTPQIIDHKILDTTKTAHAHMAQFTKNELFVVDFGLDAIKRYELKEGEYVPLEQTSLPLSDNAGPRHFTFGQNGKMLYVINEQENTIVVFQKDSKGNFNTIQTINTLDTDFKDKSYCADIHLSPDGKFLYGSNRGEDTIVIFTIDSISGKLTLVGREPVRGDWPRSFTLDPTGKFLLVANEKTNNIVVFKRNEETGTLAYVDEIELPAPVCLKFRY